MRSWIVCVPFTISLIFLLTSCAGPRSEPMPSVRGMGERVQVRPFTYTVMDTEWLDQLGDSKTPRIPEHRFLAIRLTVTNGGSSTLAIPAMTLLDAQNQSFPELNDAKGLEQWLGFIRMLAPAETEHGRVLFDVPTGSYRLRLASSEADAPDFALVDIPLQIAPVDDNGASKHEAQ